MIYIYKGVNLIFTILTVFPEKNFKNNREKIWQERINVLSLQTLSGSKNLEGPGKRARGYKKRDL
jgi:hypothetical protein